VIYAFGFAFKTGCDNGRRPSTFNVEEFNAVLDGPCTFHEGGNHTVRECQQFKRVFPRPRTPSDLEATETGHPCVATTTTAATTDVAVKTMSTVTTGDVTTTPRRTVVRSTTCLPPLETSNPNGPFQPAKRSTNMVVGGLKSSTSRRRYRKDNREVKLIHTKPSQPLRWSEKPITFSRADHWVHIQDPGSYPLVVEPNIEGALLG
jgi:hypothetical protein